MAFTLSNWLHLISHGIRHSDYKMSYRIHEGVAIPVLMNDKIMRKLKSFPLKSGDVFIVGYPKSGTTWLQIALSQLYDDWGTCKISKGKVPLIDMPKNVPGIAGIDKCQKASSPRLMKSHLPYQLFPEAVREKKCKIIYICRNPKDNAVSLYHMLQCYSISCSWDVYFPKYLRGEQIYGSWLQHVLGWLEHKNDENVFFIKYEELKCDFLGVMKRITEFIGRPVSDEEIERVAEATRFDKMRRNSNDKVVLPTIFYDRKRSPFFRKGIVGDWKNYFRKDQSEQIDRVFGDKAAEKGLEFDYEPNLDPIEQDEEEEEAEEEREGNEAAKTQCSAAIAVNAHQGTEQ